MKAILANAVAALVLMGAPARAQEHPRQPMQHPPQAVQHAQPMPHAQAARHAQMQGMGGMSCMDMMGGPSPAAVLHHAKALDLTAQQLDRLHELAKQDSTAAMPHMREAMAAHEAAAQVLRAEHPDMAAYEARLNDAARHAIAGHVAMARSAVATRELLTAAQRTRLQAEMKKMQGMMGKGMSMSGMGGMMGGGMGGGMMGGMGCMMGGGMMGGMHESGAMPKAPARPHESGAAPKQPAHQH
jgi:Spy/CpxP family protein refolding chaperone